MITMDRVSKTITFVNFENTTVLEVEGEYFRGCRRCGGEGYYSFNGEHSRCYECDNTFSGRLGEHIGDEAAARKYAHQRELRRLARIRAEERRVAKMQAALEAKVAAIPADVVEFLMSLIVDFGIYNEQGELTGYQPEHKVERSSFLVDMRRHIEYPALAERPFTPAMIAAVRKTMEARAEKAAVKAELPAVVEGRRVVTGKVISTKAVEGDYGTAYKMLVEEANGTRVFGSIASSLWNDVEFLGAYRKAAWNETDGVMTKLVGMEVTFTATVEASKDDKSFGFFKRPTKAEIVA